MNKILIQLWETSYQDNTIDSDGCSLHIDMESRNLYTSLNSTKEERYVGHPTIIEVNQSIFETVQKNKSIRLSEIELNNLIGLKDIIPL
jgi:hypothetical protein